MKRNQMLGKTMNNFDFIRIIGQGAWAVVYYGTNTKDGTQVAIKAVPKQKIVQTPKLQQLVKTEIKVLKNCHNENVIKFIDTFSNDKHIFIVTEFCNGGDLQEYLSKKKSLTEDEATLFLNHMLNGFKGLHEVGAMHRDFKVANVLLNNGVCKIADLGFAKQMVNAITNTILGTSLTMAPQVLKQNPYGKQADIWSLGVVYYQMIYGKYPYEGRSDSAILEKIKKYRPDYSKVNISENCKDFIDKCLQVDPAVRIKWEQIYQHPLIQQYQKKIKFVYGNLGQSRLFGHNKQFYKNDNKIVYPQLGGQYDISDVSFYEVKDIRKTINYEQKFKFAQKKKQMEALFNDYIKQYLLKRNDIMFVHKFISPYVYNLIHIKANHGICMFIMSKRSLIAMKEFLQDVKSKKNLFKINKYFQEFIASNNYHELYQLLKNDIDVIYSQCISYSADIQSCSNEIHEQFEIDKVKSKNFHKLVIDTIQQYWYLLAQRLATEKGKSKQSLLKVLQALSYLQGNKKISVQEFDRMMAVADMKEVQQKIQQKYMKQFE